MRWFTCLFIGVLVVTDVLAATQDAAFVAGLRERRLYDLAEEYGSERWRREDLSERERAELAIQLALVFTEQAQAAPPESRDALWAKADGACAALIDGWPNNPRRRIVEVQRALVSLARGEQARESRNLAAALDHLRVATRGLSAVADGVGRELVERRLRPRGKLPPDDLSVQEL